MVSYRIEWKKSASKELKKVDQKMMASILLAVENLKTNPFPPGVKKLIGSDVTYRIRVGVYRIVYDVYTSNLFIEIIRVRHRKDAYK